MHQNNKIGNKADTEVPFISDDDMGDTTAVIPSSAKAEAAPDLQAIFNGILSKVGLPPQTLYRGYQYKDTKDANGKTVEEKWKYVNEAEAATFMQREQPMFSTICASTYRKDSDAVKKSDALGLSRFAYFDFDADEIGGVLPKVRQFIGKLTDAGADATALHIYASGGKGFHVLVPLEMFLPNGLSDLTMVDLAGFHLVMKAIAESLYVDTLDLRIYTSARQWRRENVRRVRGTHKVSVAWSELMAMDADAYAKAVSEPRPAVMPKAAQFVPALGLIWQQAREKTAGILKARAAKAAAPRVELTEEHGEKFVSALYAIDPDGGGYADWFRGIAATHDLYGGNDEGFALVDEWSKQGRKYSYQALLSTWEGLDSGLAGANVITEASVYAMARAAGWEDKWPHLNPRNQIDSPQYRLKETDEGFAEHVAARYGDRLRYVAELKTWAAFDGRSWIFEHGISTAKDLAKQEARAHASKVVAMQPATDAEEDTRKKSLGFALGLENGKKLENIVNKMADDPRLIASVGMFDDKPYLLNLVNGTYDLERDEMRGHDAGDYLTQRMHVSRDPNAKCPRWLRFLDEITCGNKELATYLQCIAGLCLSGDVSRQEAYFMWGSGSNGKSKFWGIIQALCGDYFKPLAIEVLMYSNKPGTNNTEMAALRGARAVATGELDRGVQLRSGNFKNLTGGDSVMVQDKYVKAFTLKPQCTILIPTNFMPTIPENDHGTWRRVQILPFKAKFEGAAKDPDIMDKLKAELPGILNWAIEGFRMFKAGKMVTPACVQELSAHYRDEMDIIKNFVSDWLMEDEPGRSDRGRIHLDDLYVMYQMYCKSIGMHRAMTKRNFKTDVGEHLVDQATHARQPVYIGWRIRAEYVPENVLTERFSRASHAARSLQLPDEVDD